MTKGNDVPAKPGPEHALLGVFVGKWKAEGKSYGEGQSREAPYASAVDWIGEESFEWLPGGFFLIHRWDARLGSTEFRGIEIIGYDAPTQAYIWRMFDNHGFSPTYQVTVKNDTWTINGEAQRATVVVGNGGNTMRFVWEWKQDGSSWLPLCDRTHTRIE